MPVAARDINRRIRSIANTKKITKAMEMVSASKMRKAVNAVLATREYSNSAWDLVKDLSAKTDPSHHALLQRRDDIKRIGVVMFTSNRGLCAGFNREIIEQVAKYLKKYQSEGNKVDTDIFLMGKKGREINYRYKYNVVADFEKSDVAENVLDITPLAKMVIADYISGKYDKVVVAYTDYESAVSQKPRIRRLLPIEREDDELGYVSDDKPSKEAKEEMKEFEYIFEPSPDAVLEQMLSRLIELQIYQALLESNASEHSARMLAMRNASDAAGDMIEDLTLYFNQARQQAITSELADISAGRAAVE